jgi:hypothetical protein
MPVALPDASKQPFVLAEQNFKKRGSRSCHDSAVEVFWLAGDSPLGAFAKGC